MLSPSLPHPPLLPASICCFPFSSCLSSGLLWDVQVPLALCCVSVSLPGALSLSLLPCSCLPLPLSLLHAALSLCLSLSPSLVSDPPDIFCPPPQFLRSCCILGALCALSHQPRWVQAAPLHRAFPTSLLFQCEAHVGPVGWVPEVLDLAACDGAGALRAHCVRGLEGGTLCFPCRKRPNWRSLLPRPPSKEEGAERRRLDASAVLSRDSQGQRAGPKGARGVPRGQGVQGKLLGTG